MINSIKQILRTPFKLILFLVLCSISTALLVLGIYLWSDTNLKLNTMEESFTTIATVSQKESSMETTNRWDATTGIYTHYSDPIYNKIIPSSVLQFKNANYVKGPEKRPYYGAYMPEYNKTYENYSIFNRNLIIEFTPAEDCIPDKPVEVKINKVLAGETYGSDSLWYYDRFTENPQPLFAGKKYIACLSSYENVYAETAHLDFVPDWTPVYATQYYKTGEKIKGELDLSKVSSCEEVTADFYQKGRGKYWINLIESIHQYDNTIVVLPTESLGLLTSFHEGEASIVEGKEITVEEFGNGELVCMITTEFARNNELSVGDTISLPLYFANYRTPPGWFCGYGWGTLDFSLINAKGELYSVFWEEEYKIVGTYRYSGRKSGGPGDTSEMARDMILIPSKSVRSSDQNNIADYGPMQDATTSFQIPNGTISQYQAAFNRSVPESNSFVITYDDNGYEQISSELKNTRNIAILLGSIGVFSTLSILILLLYFFVIKQKKRTAIERSLGLSRRQCRISIISGVMLLTTIATTAGSFGSSFLLERMPTIEETNQTGYSTMYCSWAIDSTDSGQNESNETAITTPIWYINLAVPAILLFFMFISSLLLVNRNLAIEPIMLLSTKGD